MINPPEKTPRHRFRLGIFLVAAVAALGFHVFVVVPGLLLPLLERREAPIEVAYLQDEPATAPGDVPAPSATDETAAKKASEPRPPELPKVALPAPEKTLPPEVAKVEPPKPPEPQKPDEVKPPPPPPPINPRMKMVSQEQFPDEKDNLDAHYLAEKNHRAAEDVSAKNTNLVRNMKGEQAQAVSEPNASLLPDPGMKDRKIAELEERKGREHQIVRSKPLVGDDGQSPKPPKPGKLAMRDLTPKAAEPVAEVKPREGLEVAPDGIGTLPAARVGTDGERAAAARKGGNPRVKLNLTPRDYDQIEGEGVAEKERRDAARAERSHEQGRWDKVQRKMAMMRSSLENFTPEARPGNQAELGTRAHPFAAYIAEMHRSIHKMWAFGFLSDLDGKSATNPYNDMDLWTQLEIVLKPDGVVEKIVIVRPSGYGPFDAAAMDTVMSSSPFSAPPEAIKSANGKVYLDWRFHRDDRQCGTFGVDPHILTTVGDNQNHDRTEVGKAPALMPPRMLKHPQSASAPVARGESAPPPSSASGDAATTVPDAAKDAAEGWFGAYVRGDAAWLAGWSAAPLTAGGEVAAKDAAAVKKLYAELLKEAPADRRLDHFEMLTAGGVRKKLGGLPPGGEGDGSMVFAVATVKGEQFVLLLKKSDQGWRVCGIDR